MTYPILFLAALLQAPGPRPGVPILEDCEEPSRVIGTVHASDTLRVRSAIAGAPQTCYAVTAVIEGKPLNGYLLGGRLPAIQEFERQRRAATPIGEAAPAKEPGAQEEKPRLIFPDFSAVDLNGNNVSLKQIKAKVIAVCFWSPASKPSQGELKAVASLFDEFQGQGMEAVGISLDPRQERISGSLDDFSTSFPDIPDRFGLARKYDVSNVPQTFLLNQKREIVAAGLHGVELRNAVSQMIKQK